MWQCGFFADIDAHFAWGDVFELECFGEGEVADADGEGTAAGLGVEEFEGEADLVGFKETEVLAFAGEGDPDLGGIAGGGR